MKTATQKLLKQKSYFKERVFFFSEKSVSRLLSTSFSSDENEASLISTHHSLMKNEFNPKTKLIYVEDQPTLAKMFKKFAESSFYFHSVQTVVSPQEIRYSLCSTLLDALLDFDKVICVFDENLYTLNEKERRVHITGTQLRSQLFTIPALRVAYDYGSLVLVGYSTAKVKDARLAFTRHKQDLTPIRLINEIHTLLSHPLTKYHSSKQ
mmetsp:Transcript_14278/g.17745  ORF Transcript_14278/g.17745 Transcript_14278/m.17745 type:complete len:209 (-) Transcript_14278:1702-2328(-)